MKFLTDALNRIITHWQSSLFGLSYGGIFVMLYQSHIDYKQAIELLTAILAFKNVFVNKDPDKVLTKPEVKAGEIQPPKP